MSFLCNKQIKIILCPIFAVRIAYEMSEAQNKKKKFSKKLLHKYRLVILNEDTFEERLSFKLTRLNVFVVVFISAILLIVGTTFLIAFTPLREYIPGYSSTALKRRAIELTYQTDSLNRVLKANKLYFQSIQNVLTGDVFPEDINKDSIKNSVRIDISKVDFSATEAEHKLREKIAKKDKYNVLAQAVSQTNFSLFPPVSGTLARDFDRENAHFAVDVATEKNAPVKATADGTVIYAEWSVESNYVIIIEHNHGLISVYKNNASLTKEEGEMVKAGEVIGIVGEKNEQIDKPHLHFELWNDGYPIDPTDFVSFE